MLGRLSGPTTDAFGFIAVDTLIDYFKITLVS